MSGKIILPPFPMREHHHSYSLQTSINFHAVYEYFIFEICAVLSSLPDDVQKIQKLYRANI